MPGRKIKRWAVAHFFFDESISVADQNFLGPWVAQWPIVLGVTSAGFSADREDCDRNGL